MITVTHIRPYGQSGWTQIEPQAGIDRLALKQALQKHFETKLDIMLTNDEKPPERPKTFYRCLNCQKVYIAFNEGQPGQHLQPTPFTPVEGDEIIDCYPGCCYEFDRESGEMVKKDGK